MTAQEFIAEYFPFIVGRFTSGQIAPEMVEPTLIKMLESYAALKDTEITKLRNMLQELYDNSDSYLTIDKVNRYLNQQK